MWGDTDTVFEEPKKKIGWGQDDEVIEAEPIRAKVTAGETLSRADIRTLGGPSKTTEKQRKTITDVMRRRQSTGPSTLGPFDVWTAPEPGLWEGPGARFTKGIAPGAIKATQIPALIDKPLPPAETTAERVGEFVGGTAETILELYVTGGALKALGVLPKGVSLLTKAARLGITFGGRQATEEIRKGMAESLHKKDYGYKGGIAVLESIATGAILSIATSGVSAVWGKLKPSEQARALKLLGLKKGATADQIRTAAQKLAMKLHPDKVKGMENQFKKMIEARDLLSKHEAAGWPKKLRDIIRKGEPAPTVKQLPGMVGEAPPAAAVTPPTAPIEAPVAPVEPRKPVEGKIIPKAPAEMPSEQLKQVSQAAGIPPRGKTEGAIVRRLTEKQMETPQGRRVIEKSVAQTGDNIDKAGVDDTKTAIDAFDSKDFDKAFEQLVGKTNWELQQAQTAQDVRRKQLKRSSWEAVTLNIQYRNRPELLAKLSPKAPAKYQAAIKHSQKLTADEKIAVEKLEAEYAADLEKARKFGVIDGSIEHYINQIWSLPKKGKRAASAKKFGARMAESLKRKILGGYLEGINLGFEPLTLNANELRHIYQTNLARAINEKVFLDAIRDMKLPNGETLLTKIDKNTDWSKYEMVDHPALRHYRFKGSAIKKGKKAGVFGTKQTIEKTVFLEKTPLAVHKAAAPKLKAYLEKSKVREIPIIRDVLNFTAFGKYTLLAFSGFHHTALGKTAVFYGINPLPFGSRNYIAGLDLVKNADPIVRLLVEKGGLTLGYSQRIEFIKKIAGQYPEWLAKHAAMPGRAVKRAKTWWDRGLWDHYYVGLKAISGKMWFHKVRGMYPNKSDTEIAKIVSNDINNNFGGLNWDLLGASKTHIDLARLILLAPDWTLSNWKFFTDAARVSDGYRLVRKRITKEKLTLPEALAFESETGSPAMRYMGRVLITLGSLTAMVNIALWGTPFPQEDEDRRNKWYMVKLPYKTDRGAYYYIDLFGHFFEPIRAATDPVRWAKGKRSVAWKVIEEGITGRDWKGEYIKSVGELYAGIKEGDYSLYKSSYDRETTGWGAIPTRVIHGTTSIIPIPVQMSAEIATGDKKPIEAASSLGLFIRRGRPPRKKGKKPAGYGFES